MVTTSTVAWCPNARCRTALPSGAERCGACGLTLAGPDAERLFEVDRELAALWAESQRLTSQLLPAVAPAPVDRPAGRDPHRALSGQQLLLGLGAVLTLSAASFFLFVVWDLIGPAGQLVAVAALIAAAGWSSYAAARRGLTAAAETAAVLVTGLTVLVLTAAYGLGWLGVGALAPGYYFALAALATGALLLAVDRGVPTGHTVRTYRPAAALALAAAPWFAYTELALTASTEVAPVLGLLLVALADAAGAAVALRLDARRTRLGAPASALWLGAAAALAFGLHLLGGWAMGYDGFVDTSSRVLIALVLLVGPVAIGAASVLAPRTAFAAARAAAPAVALALAAPSLGILLLELPQQALTVAAVVAALALLAASVHARPLPPGWRRAATAFVALALPVLVLLVLALDAEGRASLLAPTTQDDLGPGVVASTLVAALWAVAATASAARAHRLPVPDAAPAAAPRGVGISGPAALLVLLVAVAEVAWATAAARVLVDVGSAWGWLAGGLAALVLNALLAAALVRRRSDGGADLLVELVLLLAAGAGALVAVTAADARTDGVLAATLIAVGLVVLAYASLPARLPVAYLGAVTVSLGSHVLVDAAGVLAVEATSLPLAALLAGIGLVQVRRGVTSTMVVAGPALAVALGPTLAAALDTGDDLRLAAVTAASVAVLVAGLRRQWRAPVTAGAGVLVVVAVSQGGAFVEQLPTVLVLAVAGAALLSVGVAWERAVQAGREANAWFLSLR